MTTSSLPVPMVRYLGLLESARAADPADVVACFTEDAEVIDIDDIRYGHGQIREWWAGPVTAFDYTVEVQFARALGGDRYVARTRLVGDFPGGTVELANRFSIRDGRIAQLEIAPADSHDA
jgi:hypothetical protein